MFSLGKISSFSFALLSLAAAALAFSWTYYFGHWGIYAFDQSMIFDGGWRILQGQVPYKDFLMAFTPVSFAIQAIFFKLCGVTWTATVISAATLGAILTLSVIRTLVLLFGQERRMLALISGALIGLSFQGIHGTLWIEQCAFFFCFLGIQIICETLPGGSYRRRLCFMTAGALAVLAFLCKQNAGPMVFALLLAMVILASPMKLAAIVEGVTIFLVGAGIVATMFVLWLFAYSDPNLFFHHALQVPAAVGRERLLKLDLFSIPTLMSLVSRATTWCNVAALEVWLFVMFETCTHSDKKRLFISDARRRLMLLLVLIIPFMQAIFQSSTMNFPNNLLFLSAFTLSLAAGVSEIGFTSATFRPLLRVTAIFLGLMLGKEIVRSSINRDVMFSFPWYARLDKTLTVLPLNNVRWISPTLSNLSHFVPDQKVTVTAEDVERVYDYLTAQKQRFFVMGDSNFLYGITGVNPPGPLLYFQEDHYYTMDDLPGLDAWTLANLKQDDIRLVVVENGMLDYPKFPLEKTVNWVNENFTTGPAFGHFKIMLRPSNEKVSH